MEIFLKNIQAVLNSIEGICYEHLLNDDTVKWFGNTEFINCKIEEIPTTTEGWLSGCHPEDRGKVEEEFKHAVTGKGKFEMIYRWRVKDYPYCWFRDKGLVVSTEKGPAIIGTMNDISGPADELAKTLERIRMKNEVLDKIQDSFKS